MPVKSLKGSELKSLGWSPYEALTRSGYRYIESLGLYADIYESTDFVIHDHIIVPADWTMGIVFRSKNGWRASIPSNQIRFVLKEGARVIIRDPKNLAPKGNAKVKPLGRILEIYDVSGHIEEYDLIDFLECEERINVKIILEKAIELRPRLIYLLWHRTMPISAKIIKNAIGPGPFILLIVCEGNKVKEEYLDMVNLLKGIAKIRCVNVKRSI